MLLASSGRKLWCNLPIVSSRQGWETTNRVEKEMIILCINLFNISLDSSFFFFVFFLHKSCISCIIPQGSWNSTGSAGLVSSPVISMKESCWIAAELVMKCLLLTARLSEQGISHVLHCPLLFFFLFFLFHLFVFHFYGKISQFYIEIEYISPL